MRRHAGLFGCNGCPRMSWIALYLLLDSVALNVIVLWAVSDWSACWIWQCLLWLVCFSETLFGLASYSEDGLTYAKNLLVPLQGISTWFMAALRDWSCLIVLVCWSNFALGMLNDTQKHDNPSAFVVAHCREKMSWIMKSEWQPWTKRSRGWGWVPVVDVCVDVASCSCHCQIQSNATSFLLLGAAWKTCCWIQLTT